MLPLVHSLNWTSHLRRPSWDDTHFLKNVPVWNSSRRRAGTPFIADRVAKDFPPSTWSTCSDRFLDNTRQRKATAVTSMFVVNVHPWNVEQFDSLPVIQCLFTNGIILAASLSWHWTFVFHFRSFSFPIFHFLVDLSITARLEPTGRGFGAGGVEEQVTWKRACSS